MTSVSWNVVFFGWIGSSPVSLAMLSVNEAAVKKVPSVDSEHLHDFVAQVIDDFDCDPAGPGLVEGPRRVAVERSPRILFDLGLERGFERSVGIVRPEKVRLADEEALLGVVRVDEPASNAVRTVAAHFAGVGVEHIDAIDLHS